MEDEYIIPPMYDEIEIQANPKSEIITKLEIKINRDLSLINGVFDLQILDANNDKLKKLKELQAEYEIEIENINENRKSDITKYSTKTETYLNNYCQDCSIQDELIEETTWWEFIVNKFNKFY